MKNNLKKAFLKRIGIGVKKQQFYDALKNGKPKAPQFTRNEILQAIRNRRDSEFK